MAADNTPIRNADVWAVTVYFNPMRYGRRRANYRLFREQLRVPLLTVELAYGPDFDLGSGDAEILVQRRGRDVMWQKERLLNIAIGALPVACRRVIMVDCDVIFAERDWLERTNRLLDRLPLVQPFSHLRRMPPAWRPGDEPPADAEVLHTPAFLLASGMSMNTCFGAPAEAIKCSTGSAWAAHRDLFTKHGVYDACIIGGGDSAIVRAAYGRFDDAMRLQHMNGRRRAHYLDWAETFHGAVGAEIACADGSLLHLWHGLPQDRRYRRRNEGLEPFEFDPCEDIAIDDDGPWRWNSDKPAMHEYVREYFASRREDG